ARLTQHLLQTPTSIIYGGTLSLTNLSQSTNPLAAGDSFKLFDSATLTYAGGFASLTPAAPGPGLAWDTSSLTVDGTLKLISATAQPRISSITLAGSNVTLSGSNGPANA